MSDTLYEVKCAANVPPACKENVLYPGELPFTPPLENEDFTLYVPYGSKDAYSTAWGWDCFFKIEETDFPSTGINDAVASEKIQDNSIYDLFGRKIETHVPGNLYIINGKKIIIK